MEKELNYLSEKIQGLENNITQLQLHLDKKNGCGGRIGIEHRTQVAEMTKEKTILENILDNLTFNQFV